MKKILKLLNLGEIDDNQKWILIFAFVTGLVYTYISPVLLKAVISALPEEWIAFQSLFFAGSSLLIGFIWKGRFRKAIIHRFIIFCIGECTAGFLVSLYLVFIHYNIWVYAISSLIYTSMITVLVGKCIMAFKSKLWNEHARERYDNNNSIVGGIVCLAGFSAALLFMPSLKISLILWGSTCLLDDVGWIIVYIKNKDKLKETENEN